MLQFDDVEIAKNRYHASTHAIGIGKVNIKMSDKC